jgi:RNA polymerase sigma factor (sigma-70 family)
MIRAYRARRRCLTPEAPSGWVRAIARREALRILAARGAETGSEVDRSARMPGGAAVSDGVLEDVSGAVVDRVAAQTILVQIPAGERALLVRRYLLEHSSAQIAAELQLSASTVRVRLHRALERFREHHQPGA